jgi:hypothetical protein
MQTESRHVFRSCLALLISDGPSWPRRVYPLRANVATTKQNIRPDDRDLLGSVAYGGKRMAERYNFKSLGECRLQATAEEGLQYLQYL